MGEVPVLLGSLVLLSSLSAAASCPTTEGHGYKPLEKKRLQRLIWWSPTRQKPDSQIDSCICYSFMSSVEAGDGGL